MLRQKISEKIRAHAARGGALRAAEALIRRKEVEISYRRWLLWSRKSSRDYSKMGKEPMMWEPLIGVRAYMSPGDRTAFMESLNLQVYRTFRADKNCPDADYILIVGPGCILTPDLLWQAVHLLNKEGYTSWTSERSPALFYFDSDRILEGGRKTDPAFRPGYDPDLLGEVNYMGPVVLVRADLAKQAGLPEDGKDALHAFLKRVCALAMEQEGGRAQEAIVHIPQVLYHETAACDSTHDAAAPEAEREAQGESGWEDALVSVLIPNKDHVQDLKQCIESLQNVNTWENLEILIIENNSQDPETFAYYEELCRENPRVRVLTYNGAFNYSAVNNYGAANASGDLLLLLNNDTMILESESIRHMAYLAAKPDTGAVGAMLWYPDGTIQHAGVIFGYGGIAGHALAGETDARELGTYPDLVFSHTHNVSAVTGACMMIRRGVYLGAGGLDEVLSVAFNDVDLCMRLRKSGLKILLCPQAQLCHNESVSRGQEDTPQKVERFHQEIRDMAARWKDELLEGDPYYNPNLTLTGRTWTCRDELRERSKPCLKYL